MLYSAGMGAGILLSAVQEPVYMNQNPPFESTLIPEIFASEYTFYQWEYTAWTFYSLFAMLITYGLFVKKRKPLISETVALAISKKGILRAIDVLTILI